MLETLAWPEFIRIINDPLKQVISVASVKNSLDITQHAIDFANGTGGVLVLGYDRLTMQLRGVTFDAKWLNAILVNECKPPLIFKLRELRKNSKQIFIVEVNEGIEKPYTTYTITPTDISTPVAPVKQISNTVIEREQNCLDFLQKNSTITNSQYREINSVSHKTAHNELTDLIRKGLVIQVGQGRTTHYMLNTEENREQYLSNKPKPEEDNTEAQKNLFGSTIDALLKENTPNYSRTAIRLEENTEHMDEHKTLLNLPEDMQNFDV